VVGGTRSRAHLRALFRGFSAAARRKCRAGGDLGAIDPDRDECRSMPLSAYPFGKFSDNGGRRRLLIWGIVLLIASDLMLALAGNIWLVGLGAAIWGLHMGATQGLLSVLVADAAPADLRGTAFGVFNLVSGLALLAASVLAGSCGQSSARR
jgi:MFS family permease